MFAGQSLRGLRRDTVSRLGIGRTYQIPRPFGDLTVLENVAMPLMFRAENRLGRPRGAGRSRAFRRLCRAWRQAHRTRRPPDACSSARPSNSPARWPCRPRLLLVDEVASGLTAAEVRRFVGHIREVRDAYGITVIWVEHIISALTQVVDRLVVLEQGSIIADGAAADRRAE